MSASYRWSNWNIKKLISFLRTPNKSHISLCKHGDLSLVAGTCNSGTREVETNGAHWPTDLVKSASSSFNERPPLNKVDGAGKMGKSTCLTRRQPELDPWNPRCKETMTLESCTLASTSAIWHAHACTLRCNTQGRQRLRGHPSSTSSLHIHAHVYTHIHHIQIR